MKHSTEEPLALLKILALGDRQIEEGKIRPAKAVIESLRHRQVERARRGKRS